MVGNHQRSIYKWLFGVPGSFLLPGEFPPFFFLGGGIFLWLVKFRNFGHDSKWPLRRGGYQPLVVPQITMIWRIHPQISSIPLNETTPENCRARWSTRNEALVMVTFHRFCLVNGDWHWGACEKTQWEKVGKKRLFYFVAVFRQGSLGILKMNCDKANWAMERKPWLLRVYRGLYCPLIRGL